MTFYNTPEGEVDVTLDMDAFSGVHAVKLNFDPDDLSTLNNPMVTIHYSNGKVTRALFEDAEVFPDGGAKQSEKKASNYRTFFDDTGRHRFEALVKRRGVDHVLLEAPSKEVRKVGLNRLSKVDLRWLDANHPLDPRIKAEHETAGKLQQLAQPILQPLAAFVESKSATTVQNQVSAQDCLSAIEESCERFEKRRIMLTFEVVDVHGESDSIVVRIKPNSEAVKVLTSEQAAIKYYSDDGETLGNDGGVLLPLTEIAWRMDKALMRNAKAGNLLTVSGYPRYSLSYKSSINPKDVVTLLNAYGPEKRFALFPQGMLSNVTIDLVVEDIRLQPIKVPESNKAVPPSEEPNRAKAAEVPRESVDATTDEPAVIGEMVVEELPDFLKPPSSSHGVNDSDE